MPPISPYTFADLRTPKDRATNKNAIFDDLIAQGFRDPYSWEEFAVPHALIQTEAQAITDFQLGRKEILESGFNEFAIGDALTEHSKQVYNNLPLEGKRTIGRFLLSDTGNGDFTFDPTSVSFSIGEGGLVYNGILDPTLVTPPTKVTLPVNGSLHIYAEAAEEGDEYNAAIGTVTTFSRGILPGVNVTNPSDWLSAPGTQVGAKSEGDDSKKLRNTLQWETLSVGSSLGAYLKLAKDSDVAITRLDGFRNLDPLDPGTITILIAGDSGAVPPGTVANAQNAIAPAQIGGENQPETAKAIVSSATNNVIAISGTIYLPGEINTLSFRTKVQNNIQSFFKRLKIGQKISAERILASACYEAGLDPSIIVDIGDDFQPKADTVQLYYQVAVPDLSLLKFVSV